MNSAMLTVPSFTINKKEFFTLWVKNYLLSMKLQTLKEKFLDHKDYSYLFSDIEFNRWGKKAIDTSINNLNPINKEQLKKLFIKMSNCQFTMREMKNGTAYKVLKKSYNNGKG